MEALSPNPNELEADLAQLDVGMRQLKIQYDMFLAGGIKKEPVELRGRLESIIKKHSNKPIQKYVQRFRFSALVSRFNSMSELWGKRVRSMEEGAFRHEGFAERLGIKERLLARALVAGPLAEQADLRRLHSRYVAAHRRAGRDERQLPSFEAFLRKLTAHTDRLRREARCDSIELRLVERDDGVELKARPGR